MLDPNRIIVKNVPTAVISDIGRAIKGLIVCYVCVVRFYKGMGLKTHAQGVLVSSPVLVRMAWLSSSSTAKLHRNITYL